MYVDRRARESTYLTPGLYYGLGPGCLPAILHVFGNHILDKRLIISSDKRLIISFTGNLRSQANHITVARDSALVIATHDSAGCAHASRPYPDNLDTPP